MSSKDEQTKYTITNPFTGLLTGTVYNIIILLIVGLIAIMLFYVVNKVNILEQVILDIDEAIFESGGVSGMAQLRPLPPTN